MFFSKKLKKFKEINTVFFQEKVAIQKGVYKSLNCGRGSKEKKKIFLET